MAATSPIKDPDNGVKVQVVHETAVTAVGTGYVDITFDHLKEVYAATLTLAAGYVANAATYTAGSNKVRFNIYQSAATAAAFGLVGAAGDLGAGKAVAFGR